MLIDSESELPHRLAPHLLRCRCKHIDIDPFGYLHDLATEFPTISNTMAEQLNIWLPDAWAKRQTVKSKQA